MCIRNAQRAPYRAWPMRHTSDSNLKLCAWMLQDNFCRSTSKRRHERTLITVSFNWSFIIRKCHNSDSKELLVLTSMARRTNRGAISHSSLLSHIKMKCQQAQMDKLTAMNTSIQTDSSTQHNVLITNKFIKWCFDYSLHHSG